jgi:hypothetical protein
MYTWTRRAGAIRARQSHGQTAGRVCAARTAGPFQSAESLPPRSRGDAVCRAGSRTEQIRGSAQSSHSQTPQALSRSLPPGDCGDSGRSGGCGIGTEWPGLSDGQNSCLLVHHLLSQPQPPDCYLFRVSSDVTGVLEIERSGWKSDGVVLISLSQFREQQEAMLMVPIHGWIRGALGRFAAEPLADCRWRASLESKG